MNGNPHTISFLVFVSVIVTSRSDKAHLPCHADSSILWCLPYTHNVLHRRVLDGFRLLVLTDLHDRSVNLATIDDRAWRIGTAQRKCRHGIACLVKFQMVEIHLAIGNEVNKSVTVDVAEILSGLGLSG